MSGLRNQPGQLAVVVPFEGAEADIQAHGGKVVTPIYHGACGLGPDAWSTFPVLYDGFGNALAWDDRDLKPLGEKPSWDWLGEPREVPRECLKVI